MTSRHHVHNHPSSHQICFKPCKERVQTSEWLFHRWCWQNDNKHFHHDGSGSQDLKARNPSKSIALALTLAFTQPTEASKTSLDRIQTRVVRCFQTPPPLWDAHPNSSTSAIESSAWNNTRRTYKRPRSLHEHITISLRNRLQRHCTYTSCLRIQEKHPISELLGPFFTNTNTNTTIEFEATEAISSHHVFRYYLLRFQTPW